jgi:multidrug efflux pump subunit AcrB
VSGPRRGDGDASSRRGVFGWVVDNRVAANLLMAFFLVGGIIFLRYQVKREVFPEAQLNAVTITVAYPGATPAETSEAIVLPIEEAIRGVDGIEEIRANASAGTASVVAEMEEGVNPNQVRSDIESAIDRITSFPAAAEEPVIALPSNQRQVLSLILHGETTRARLDRLADEVRADLLRDPRVSRVRISGIPAPEISIEVPVEAMRRYGLSLPEIAARVREGTVETGAGSLETPGGNVRLRIMEDRERAEAFRDLTVIADPGGVRVPLGAFATVRETYREEDRTASFDGHPAVNLGVFRAAGEDPVATATAVREYLDRAEPGWGDGIEARLWNNFARIYEDRVDLLLKNGFQGLILVLLVLGLFLRPRLAFWVTLGLPVSFLGAFIFLPMLGATINMISLFAFILVLGIVVDDAIVVGESCFHEQERGMAPAEAAVVGTRAVATPVIFSVTTTMLAFAPMLFIPGVTGEFFEVIPLVVLTILGLSLIESLVILPAHLAHSRSEPPRGRLPRRFFEWQQRFSEGFNRRVDRHYRPTLRWLLAWRYLVLAGSLGLLVLTAALFAGGHLRFVFFPDIEGTTVIAQVEMVEGTSARTTEATVERVRAALRASLEEGGHAEAVEGTFTLLGQRYGAEEDPTSGAAGGGGGSHLATVIAMLTPADQREVSSSQVADRWRARLEPSPGVRRILFSSSAGPAGGAELAFELSLENVAQLENAASRLADALGGFAGVTEIDPGYSRGREELRLRLTPAARALGLTEESLARQVRAAFFGVEALRQPRGRDELRVYVRLPEADRATLETLREFVLFADPENGQIPLDQAAELSWARSYTSIEREGGRRTLEVTADVAGDRANRISGEVTGRILPELVREFPGLSWELSGERQQQAETLSALWTGFALSFLIIYGLLATVFRSYSQPLLILLAVPFGLIGAVLGHVLLRYDLSIISVLGIVALAGVVVNDSLVLIDYINRRRRDGAGLEEALEEAGVRRFRPILLTSLTTFFGLAPMIAETSIQARFLIPMAISLGFGVIFVTPIALGLVPVCYRILEDVRGRLPGRR